MLSSFDSVIKSYSHYLHWKNHKMSHCTHLLQQRIKTSEQNAFFAQENVQSIADGDRRPDEIFGVNFKHFG